MIETQRNLDILCMVEVDQGLTDESVTFPSWVPRFDLGTVGWYIPGQDLYKTSNGLPSFPLPSLDENALILRGLRFDSLVSDGKQILGKDVLDYSRIEDPEIFDSIWDNIANQADAYTEGKDRLWAFYITMKAGQTMDWTSAENDSNHRAGIWAYEKQLVEAAEVKRRKPSNRREMWGTETQTQNEDGNPTKFQLAVANASRRRRIFVMENGYMGLGPSSMNTGDVVCVLFGGDVPYVLRRKGSHWQFLGCCYVHGIMKGEALKGFDGDISQAEVFEIR
jgi:hypothetical protein